MARAAVGTRLALGTAQLGLSYGVSNLRGKPADAEVASILRSAKAHGIEMLDTAPAYGDAQSRIGCSVAEANAFKIVTKIGPFEEEGFDSSIKERILGQLHAAASMLKVESLYGVLVHRSSDLLKRGAHLLIAALDEARARGFVKRAGVSVYQPSDVAAIERIWSFDIIQFPLNVLDGRFVSEGVLAHLNERGVEVHVRSAFLQGVLLMELSRVPRYFEPVRAELELFHSACCEEGLSPLEGALSHVLGIRGIDKIVVGVNSEQELREIVNARITDRDFGAGRPIPVQYINPSMWPAFH